MTPKQRREFVASLPWVKRLKTPVACDGLLYSKMPLRALYYHGPKRSLPPTGTDPYKCKKVAYWKFKALKKSWAKDGTFCMSHLFSQIDMDEQDRMDRWIIRKYGSLENWQQEFFGG